MKNKSKLALYTALMLILFALTCIVFVRTDMIVIFPKGMIGIKQRDLLILSTLLMLIVVIPVFALIYYVVHRYHEDGDKKNYRPNWGHSAVAELVWWGVPFIIIVILGTINWITCYTLDQYRPIQSSKKPIEIQVVALQWKWLFIYPKEGFATVNYIQFPVDVPVHFTITADAPMNSFWIPELGGQIFAMPGMRTELNLIANEAGTYKGLSANLSGSGFAGMRFNAEAVSEDAYRRWVSKMRGKPELLDRKEFLRLAKPSKNNPVAVYSFKDKTLFKWIVTKDSMAHGSK